MSTTTNTAVLASLIKDIVAVDLEGMRDDEYFAKVNSTISELAAVGSSQSLLQAATNKRNRPKPLEIFDLPDEVLSRIFEFVRGGKRIYEKDLHFVEWGPSTESIRHVRLTCHRFCETSSHLLLDYIPVCLTRQSLAHLEEVSRHPLLSKGVRAIKLSLNPYYDAVHANDIQAFAAYNASKLRETVEYWETVQSNFQNAPKGLTETIVKAYSLANSWDQVAAQGINATDTYHMLLLKAYEKYGTGYRDYMDLCNSLAQRIASAMERMPTASWLSTDDCRHIGQYITTLRPNDLDSPDSLQEKLAMPLGDMHWSSRKEMRKCDLEPPPFYLISDLLLSIQQVGVTLKGLDLGTPPPADGVSIAQTTREQSELLAAARQLKTIQFHPRNNCWETEWSERPAEAWKPIIKFLTHLIRTESLQKLDLNFYFMMNDDHQPTLSMAPIIMSFAWPNLEILRFNGPFYFEELRFVVERLDKKVKLQWSGFLMSGSWAGVLDFLKGTTLKQIEVGDVNGSIYGQEHEEMSAGERKVVFEGDYRVQWNVGSLATQYVRGWRESNPVREWENGTLQMPEPQGDD